MIKFISALRAQGLRVSLAESEDAFNAINMLGVHERETFRLSLRATLVKDTADLKVFDELFPLFFSANTPPPLINLAEDLTPQEAGKIAEAIRHFNQHLQNMLDKLMHGEPLSQQELEQLAQMIGLQHANDLRYQEWMARRMEQALRFEEVREAIQELMDTLAEMDLDPQRLEQIRQLLEANQAALGEQLRQYVGQRIAENLSDQPPEEDIDRLLNRPFNALSEKNMQILRDEVRRLAAILRSRVALRQKRAKSGKLDPKATIRTNLKHNSVPFQIKYRNRHLKPKLVVLCDISTSMRYCSELMLSLIYAMQDLVSKTNAFAFIDHLEYITPDFQGKRANEAVGSVLRRIPTGYYSTDLGYTLSNFASDYLDKIDSRTTFIMVGDGRNNYNNPQVEIFRTISRRSHRTIWINPEPRIQWGTGDSDMWQYAPYCDDILKAATLNELTAAVDKLLN
ncbi:MAG: VWA domain-containing protein [Chloroflexi bacterium]|nr:VWA domain-containing protein [Chloroflexota bacterium]